jgi:flagellar biosynthetic protein FlhF
MAPDDGKGQSEGGEIQATRSRSPFAALRARLLRGSQRFAVETPVESQSQVGGDAVAEQQSVQSASPATSHHATLQPKAKDVADVSDANLDAAVQPAPSAAMPPAAESVARLFAQATARHEGRGAPERWGDSHLHGEHPEQASDVSTPVPSQRLYDASVTHRSSRFPTEFSDLTAKLPTADPQVAPQIVVSPNVSEATFGTAAQNMMAELQALRTMLHDQTTGLASLGIKVRDPVRARMFQIMINSGFSAQLTRYLLENLPNTDSVETAQGFVQRAMELNLTTLDEDNGLLDRGGVFALMGPTGVGKTTTTAKLAARFVLRHGASRVALLTTDSYRIGGHEQLRIYGRILGVSVHAVRDGEDLGLALADLRDKHVVLIDTIGMSQRDRALAEQIAMLQSAGPSIQRLLLLNTTSNGKTLDEVVHAYRDAGLAGCILTKIDEAAMLGHALDVLVRHKLPLQYVSCGQRVPEDIAVANAKLLVHRAFRDGLGASPFTLEEDESYILTHGASNQSAVADMTLPA